MKHTSEEWQKPKPEVRVLDLDGWDRQNLTYSWYKERISEKEYEQRLMM